MNGLLLIGEVQAQWMEEECHTVVTVESMDAAVVQRDGGGDVNSLRAMHALFANFCIYLYIVCPTAKRSSLPKALPAGAQCSAAAMQIWHM
jgi:hypothetical protein